MEQQPQPSESHEPISLHDVLEELMADPTQFTEQHVLDEQARKMTANLSDVESEIQSLKEDIKSLRGEGTPESEPAIRDINMRLLSAYALRATLRPPQAGPQ